MADPKQKALLVILDGYGLAVNPEVSAIHRAKKPFIDSLFETYPHSHLSASGEDVGLPDGQFGNSEVGHLNIGAGRIVRQELSRINHAIDSGDFYNNEVLKHGLDKAKSKGKVHIMGLFSDGGVHSHNEHLFALLKMCKNHGLENVYVHAFTDGRDTSPKGGIDYAREFNTQAEKIGVGKLASIVGRYYIMDRDNRWERIQKGYDLLVNGKGESFENSDAAFEASYANDVTDEFILPILMDESPESRISEGDVVIYYNIRGDRARQITRAFTIPGFSEFPVQNLNLHYVTFTEYDETFRNVNVAFPPMELKNTIGRWVSSKGFKQFRIAETEKYPHVTYFFNGGDEVPNEGEDRIVIPSPKVATYDLQPEMSAEGVADTLTEKLDSGLYEFVVLNFANTDMVGHTGIMEAAVKAVEAVDTQLKKVIESAIAQDYAIIVIADHGNADQMIKEDGSPHTAHTTSLVPIIAVNCEGVDKIDSGILADVAPTLLKLMGLEQPNEMTGKPLI